MSERVMAQVVLLSTVVLALAGAALGATFFDALGTIQTLIIVAFSGLLGIALALLWVFSEKTPESQPIPPTPKPPKPAMPTPVPPSPAPAPEANNAWWNQTGKPAAPPVTQAAKKAVPLTDFDAHRAQIAQCPRCAGFELDVRRDGRACAFACGNPHCRNTWEWLPGTAWPPTVVRHNLTRAASAEQERR